MTLDIFTSVATNYIPKARVLAHSVKTHQPDARFHLLVTDELPADFTLVSEPFDTLITLKQLEIPDLRSWLFTHNIVEACTAVKPFALNYLLRQGAQHICYFDPDIALFAPLTPIEQAFASGSILLTPHICEAENTLEAIKDNELNSLRHGLYNFGFFAVKNDATGRAYADWWQERVYHWCYDDIAAGIFTDQKWNDHVPIFFDEVAILKHPGLNVATWNYAQRRLEGTLAQGITVNGQPLIFHHFTGYDSGAHHIMRDKYGSDMPAALELSRWYEDACLRHSQRELEAIKWAYGYYDNGEEITPQQRVLYRRRKDLQQAFPDPFSTKAQGEHNSSYYHWLQREGMIDIPALPDLAAKPFRLFLRQTRESLLYYISNTNRLRPWQKRLAGKIVKAGFTLLVR